MDKQKLHNKQLTEALCRHFRLDVKKITYVEVLEMTYIFDYVQNQLLAQMDEIDRIFSEVRQLQRTVKLNGRSKKRKLYELYYWCQHQNMERSGRYDTHTLKVPKSSDKPNYY